MDKERRPPIRRERTGPPATAELLKLVEKSLDDDKAEDIVVIDLAGKTDIADFMVIANGRSQRQIGTMADHLQHKLKTRGLKGIAAEGIGNCDWVLIDAGDVIVHLFRPEIRDFYNLDKMWMDAPKREPQQGLTA